MGRAKIVCTLGPASSSEEMIEALIGAGAGVFRLNFSHGAFEEQQARLQRVRKVSGKLGRAVSVLLDLPGVKIRLGPVENGAVSLENGQPVRFVASQDSGTAACLTTGYPDLLKELRAGDRILIDDGLIELRAEKIEPGHAECQVVIGGVVRDRKGVSFPQAGLNAPSLTQRDLAALDFAAQNEVEYLALSFVRSAANIRDLKARLAELHIEIPVVAKLEKPQALEHLEEILQVTDAVMVARGDLAVELSPAEVPVAQKRILRAAHEACVPAIVATQMLESMTHNPRPTRAEASDVANAVFDGADALMLSGETAVGDYPRDTVAMMTQIIEVAEADPTGPRKEASFPIRSTAQAVCLAACQTANNLRARCLVAFTESGMTARYLSQARPQVPILAFTPHKDIYQRMNLLWGVTPYRLPYIASTDAMIRSVDRFLLSQHLVESEDLLVIVCGAPVGTRDSTNLIKVHRAGARDV